MRPAVKKILLSVVLALSVTTSAFGLETTSSSPKIAKAPDRKIIDSWRERGAIFGWIGLSPTARDLLEFRVDETGLPGEIPAFQVRGPIKNRFVKLSVPEVPWGLHLLNGRDADIEGLPSTEKLFALKSGFGWSLELKNDKILRLKDLRWLDCFSPEMRQLPKLFNLEAMSLEGNKFDEKALSELVSFPNLEYLSLSGNHKLTPVEWDALASDVFSRLDKLCGLDLSSTEVSEKDLSQLSGLKRLVHLKLGFTDIDPTGVARLPNLSQLKTLDLTSTEITDSSIHDLTNSQQLESLDLSFTEVSDAGLSVLEKLKSLREISFSGTSITDGAIGKSSMLEHLESLDLSSISKVSVATLSAIPADGPLRNLRLNNTDVGEAEILAVSQLQKLRSLSLSGARITKKRLEYLGRLTQLEDLDLYQTTGGLHLLRELPEFPRLTRLNLDGTNVSDNDLSALKKFPRLSTLRLCSTAVSDNGIDELARIKSLSGIAVFDTRVTAAGVKRLEESLPASWVTSP